MPENYPASGPSADLRKAISAVSPTAVLARIYPERRAVTHLYGRNFQRLSVGQAVELVVAHMVRQKFGDAVDWRHAHDFYLPASTLYRTPEPHRKGYVPEDDLTFGLALAHLIAICDGDGR